MFIFVVNTGKPTLYPPHGLRVATGVTWEEIVEDITEYLDGNEKLPVELDEALVAKDVKKITEGLDMVCSGSWSIYSEEDGYFTG